MKRKFIKKFAQERKNKELWEQALTNAVSGIQAFVKRRGLHVTTKNPKHKFKSFWVSMAV